MVITKKETISKASRYPCDPVFITTQYYLFGFIKIWQWTKQVKVGG